MPPQNGARDEDEDGVADHMMKCAVCKRVLGAGVRMLPCESSICAGCYDGIRAQGLDEARNFICKACSKRHAMPAEASGLPDKFFLFKLTFEQPAEAQLGEGARHLRIYVQHLPGQNEALRTLDDQLEINTNDFDASMEVVFSTAMTLGDFLRVEEDPRFVEFIRDQLRLDAESAKPAEAAKRPAAKSPPRAAPKPAEKVEEYKTKLRDSANRHKKEATGSQSPRQTARPTSAKTSTKPTGSQKKSPTTPRKPPSRVLYGHTDYVRKVIFLPDGTLASCSDDKSIRIWNLENGQLVLEFRGHTKWVYSIALLQNGCLASGSVDQTVKIWDLKERRAPRTLLGHKSCVIAVIALQNDNLASCSFDDTVKIWNSASGSQLYSLNGHCIKRWIHPLGMLSNGHLVALLNGLRSTIVRVWSPADGRLLKSIETGLKDALSVLVLANDDIAVGFKDGTIKIVNPRDNQIRTLKGSSDEVCLLAQLPSGHLVSCSFQDNSSIRIWNLEDGSLVRELPNENRDAILSLSVSPDGRVAYGSTDHSIKLINLNL